jgi:hypothetical protein
MMMVFRFCLVVFVTYTIGVSAIIAQDGETARSQFFAKIKQSYALTKDSPIRNITTVETGDTSTTKDWKPYSSWIEELILPDRQHFKYTLRGSGEFIQIEKTKYHTDPQGHWTSTFEEGGPSLLNPASPRFGFADDSTVFSNISSEVPEKDVTVFRLMYKRKPVLEDPEKSIFVKTFWFDERGVLFKEDVIGYNGRNWVRTTQNYEYDPNIRIEAPIPN